MNTLMTWGSFALGYLTMFGIAAIFIEIFFIAGKNIQDKFHHHS